MGPECYSLDRKTANYKGEKFFLIRVKMGPRRGTGEAHGKVAERREGDMGGAI